jgi:hypothetical protein
MSMSGKLPIIQTDFMNVPCRSPHSAQTQPPYQSH